MKGQGDHHSYSISGKRKCWYQITRKFIDPYDPLGKCRQFELTPKCFRTDSCWACEDDNHFAFVLRITKQLRMKLNTVISVSPFGNLLSPGCICRAVIKNQGLSTITTLTDTVRGVPLYVFLNVMFWDTVCNNVKERNSTSCQHS